MPISLTIFMDMSFYNYLAERSECNERRRNVLESTKILVVPALRLRLRLRSARRNLSRLCVLGELDQLLRHFRADACLGFLGGGADMRGGDHVIELDQFPICGRFFDEDIDRRTSDFAVGQCFVEGI